MKHMGELEEMVELELMLKFSIAHQFLAELYVINDDVVELLELLEVVITIEGTLDVMVEIDNQKSVIS